MALGDWEQVVMSYRNVLELYPDYADAYSIVNGVLHEKLFRFSDTFALNQQWLEGHPDDLAAQMNFAEAHLTTGRFGEAVQRFSNLLDQPELDPQAMIPLSLIRIVGLLGLRQDEQIPELLARIQASVAVQPAEFTLGWSFEGTKHFIGQHEAFATSRDWLLPLLAEISGTTRDAMLTAVEKAQSRFVAAESSNKTLPSH
jgi:tetratricopeptide (TPR) repeat protein